MDDLSTVKWLLAPRSQAKRRLLLGGGLAALLLTAEYHGYVSGAYRWMKRSFSSAVANWLEEKGGFPLFTVEGEEPENAKLSWDLPFVSGLSNAAAQGAEDAAQQLVEGQDETDDLPVGGFASPSSSSTGDLPNFFASTKFFSCLDLKESQELFEATQMVTVQPHEMLFQVGESSRPGIFIVLEGQLGVFLPEGDQLRHTNTLRTGESVGDLDVLDGARRSVTCMALSEETVLVQVSRELFIRFVAANPRTLQIYLHKAMARLWRVAHFVLSDFLDLKLEEASSASFKEAANLQSSSQLRMPDSAVQRPLTQPAAQNELKQLRFSGLPQDPSSEEVTLASQSSSRGDAANSAVQRSEAADNKTSRAVPSMKRDESQKTGRRETREGNQPSGKSRGGRGLRFQPRLEAVRETGRERGSMESQPSNTEACSSEGSSQAPEQTPSVKPQTSLLSLELRKSRELAEIAESPFANASRQSSGTSSLDASPENTVSGGQAAGDSLAALETGEAGEPSGDSRIASSIRAAMTQLRAASLPAALVRPNTEEAEATEIQGDSPKSPIPGTSANSEREGGLPARTSGNFGGTACLRSGWDVVSPEECCLSDELWQLLRAAPHASQRKKPMGVRVTLRRGDTLHSKDQPCRQFSVLLEGRLLAERSGKNSKLESGLITPGSLIGCASFLSSSRNRESIRASQTAVVAVFGLPELNAVMKRASDCFVELLLAAARALGPVIRRFISLGLNRVWLDAGSTAYRQGETATCLFIIISGRLRLVREDPGSTPPVRVEEEVGRGEAVGAVWALAGGYHDTTALCVRDAELVRMSRGAFDLIAAQCPLAVVSMLSGIGRRLAAASAIRSHRSLYDPSGRAAVATPVPAASSMRNGATGGGTARRGEVVTVALVPAGCQMGTGVLSQPPDTAALAVKKLGELLKHTLEELFGPTLLLSSVSMELMFPTSYGRLSTTFYRSKLTSWMAAQEEDYRYILMEADCESSPWTRICISQADCILLVALEDSEPQVNIVEHSMIWAPMGRGPLRTESSLKPEMNVLTQGSLNGSRQGYTDAKIFAARMRRVELVLLHSPDREPRNTNRWLDMRPHLARHHHARLSHSKDLARIARWLAGKAVGLVLSGGGSRGLAHLGVLHALDDAGVPIDVIGGTSQGAFMAGLYAQGLTWEQMHRVVRNYASQMGSVRHLLLDLTLPIISVFNGRGFDDIIKGSFKAGPQMIEDLWLRYFCISTNLSRGEPSVHERGLLHRLVRASMTLVGLVPPVYHEGELLVDGGYLNNIPVDVMRGLGVDSVIVVDVEDKDASVWRNLSAYDGGVSGWQLLWDRWCPIPSLRYGIKLPRYQQIINHLTWMSHSQNLKRVSREHVIDLYLQPPVGKFRLMDFHLMERLVRDANRYAYGAIAEWQCRQGVSRQGMIGTRPLKETAKLRMRRAHSIPCMTQLQLKQSDMYSGETSEADFKEAVRPGANSMEPPNSNQMSEPSSAVSGDESASNAGYRASRSFEAARPRGLFQIVGPLAIPSSTDLPSLDADPTATAIGSLPSRRYASAGGSASSVAGDFGDRRPSLEAQLRSVAAETVEGWLSASPAMRHNVSQAADDEELPSTSEAALPAMLGAIGWPGDVGEGPLALPNQAILPEHSRPSKAVPEVRRASLTDDATLSGRASSRAIRGLTSRPSFTESDISASVPDDDLDAVADLLQESRAVESPSSASGVSGTESPPPYAKSRWRSSGRSRFSSAPNLARED